jgi:hypothetical protein
MQNASNTEAEQRKAVLVRVPPALLAAVKAHQANLTSTMGGAQVPFVHALLHLVQTGVDALAIPPENI